MKKSTLKATDMKIYPTITLFCMFHCLKNRKNCQFWFMIIKIVKCILWLILNNIICGLILKLYKNKVIPGQKQFIHFITCPSPLAGYSRIKL